MAKISSTNRSWGGNFEIKGLENEAHLGGHLYNLPRHEAELLVVVQHSVHVLDPNRVHRPVKDQPLAVGGLRKQSVPVVVESV